MEYAVIMSGFGGQGVLLMGELLAHCGMKAGLNVTWMPAYGVEMRGGTANCTVVLSDRTIGSPITGRPQAVIAMSEPAVHKFAPLLPAGGLLLLNSSLVRSDTVPADRELEIVYVPTLELAAECGNEKMANIVMLGALIARLVILEPKACKDEIDSFLPPGKRGLAEDFRKALDRGFAHAALHGKAG